MADANANDVPREAWLFVRETESVLVTRLPLGSTLLVCGPGATEHSHHFDGDAALEEFRRMYERYLTEAGFALTQRDRRRRDGAPRSGPERRRAPREAVVLR